MVLKKSNTSPNEVTSGINTPSAYQNVALHPPQEPVKNVNVLKIASMFDSIIHRKKYGLKPAITINQTKLPYEISRSCIPEMVFARERLNFTNKNFPSALADSASIKGLKCNSRLTTVKLTSSLDADFKIPKESTQNGQTRSKQKINRSPLAHGERFHAAAKQPTKSSYETYKLRCSSKESITSRVVDSNSHVFPYIPDVVPRKQTNMNATHKTAVVFEGTTFSTGMSDTTGRCTTPLAIPTRLILTKSAPQRRALSTQQVPYLKSVDSNKRADLPESVGIPVKETHCRVLQTPTSRRSLLRQQILKESRRATPSAFAVVRKQSPPLCPASEQKDPPIRITAFSAAVNHFPPVKHDLYYPAYVDSTVKISKPKIYICNAFRNEVSKGFAMPMSSCIEKESREVNPPEDISKLSEKQMNKAKEENGVKIGRRRLSAPPLLARLLSSEEECSDINKGEKYDRFLDQCKKVASRWNQRKEQNDIQLQSPCSAIFKEDLVLGNRTLSKPDTVYEFSNEKLAFVECTPKNVSLTRKNKLINDIPQSKVMSQSVVDKASLTSSRIGHVRRSVSWDEQKSTEAGTCDNEFKDIVFSNSHQRREKSRSIKRGAPCVSEFIKRFHKCRNPAEKIQEAAKRCDHRNQSGSLSDDYCDDLETENGVELEETDGVFEGFNQSWNINLNNIEYAAKKIKDSWEPVHRPRQRWSSSTESSSSDESFAFSHATSPTSCCRHGVYGSMYLSQDDTKESDINDIPGVASKRKITTRKKLNNCNSVDFDSGISEDLEDIKPRHRTYSNNPRVIDLIQKSKFQTLWSHVPEVFNSDFFMKLTSSDRKLQEAKFEIITTEASYNKSLDILISQFLESESLNDEKVLCKRDREILFSNVIPVKKCSEKLLADLEGCWQEDVSLQDLGEIIHNHAEKNFHVYITYCKNQVQQEKMLKQLMKSAKFVAVIEELESHPNCQNMSLQCFLILPMQRVTRMRLLVEGILARLPFENLKHETWKMALNTLNNLVQECNDEARCESLTEDMKSLCKKIDFSEIGKFDLAINNRFLIKKGKLLHLYCPDDPSSQIGISSSMNNTSVVSACLLPFGRKIMKQSLQLFLFTDIVVIAKKKSDENFTVLDYCERDYVDVVAEDPALFQELPQKYFIEAQKNIFHLFLLKNCQNRKIELILSTTGKCEKKQWLEAFSSPFPKKKKDVTHTIVKMEKADPREKWNGPPLKIPII